MLKKFNFDHKNKLHLNIFSLITVFQFAIIFHNITDQINAALVSIKSYRPQTLRSCINTLNAMQVKTSTITNTAYNAMPIMITSQPP